MNPERLVAMANDIANFFAAEPDRQVAVDGVVAHIVRFWTPRMREQLAAHANDVHLSDLARAASVRLAPGKP
jgi:formate dehydrogenase subunit delta